MTTRLHAVVHTAAVKVVAAATAAVLAAGCGVGLAERAVTTPGTSPSGSPTATSSSSGFQWSDCDSIRPGDPFVGIVGGLHCDEKTPISTIECSVSGGTYIHLSPRGGDPVEGIEGVTSTWLKAEPEDLRYGRTPFAFNNCKEHV